MPSKYQVERRLEAEFVGQRFDAPTAAVMLARARESLPEARSLYIDEAGRLHIVADPAPVLQFGRAGTQ